MVGKTVHHYQFLEKLGAGGMGEIWKAQDTRLNRIVAVKILTEASAGDPERRRRFIQEAQAASALNHPNIITIHDIISEGNAEYMVMEYVQGKTLIDLIPKGGLRVPQVLKYAVQMTDALQVAHAAGIIHRDLKPGNVMVTESGLVKVLDFGLAKLTDNSPLSQTGASAQTDATQTINHAPLTVEGSIIGTVSYMSPEQAQGKKVDSRSDIFSFAVVLYEMVTGSRAFAGDSALSTLSAILRDEVRPIPEIAPDTPPQLDQVIHRCLRKNPDQRFQTMKEVQIALGALKHESDSGMLYRTRVGIDAGPIPKGSRMPLIIAASVAAAVVAIGGGGARWWWTHRANPEAVVQTPVAAPPAAAVQPSPVVTPVAAPVAPAAPADQALTNDNIIRGQGRQGPRDDAARESGAAAAGALRQGARTAPPRPCGALRRGVVAARARAQVPARRIRVGLAVRVSLAEPLSRSGERSDPPPSRAPGHAWPRGDACGACRAVRQAGELPHAAPLLRHASARTRLRHPHGAGAARSLRRVDHHDLYARDEPRRARREEPARPARATAGPLRPH